MLQVSGESIEIWPSLDVITFMLSHYFMRVCVCWLPFVSVQDLFAHPNPNPPHWSLRMCADEIHEHFKA